MTALLEMRAVTRVHGHGAREVTALRGVDLAVQPGEFVALMGPSGSGKSTLLHLAGGLALPTSGEVLVDGKSLTGLSPAERAVLRRDVLGYVFQELNLLPGLTALELAGLRTRPARAAALGALAEVGIEELASRMPAELSGGQSQRVAIARSLVGPRRLLLADEPTGALDSMSGRDIIALLRGRADAGAGVVLVTHEPRFAAWADRTLQLRDGDVVGVAAPEVTPWSA